MEHTNEFLMGMFAAYMGCEVKHTYHDKDYNCNSVELTPSRFSQISDPTTQDAKYWSAMIYFKPILTPLSEISNDDAVEVAKIFKYQVSEHDKLKFLGLELVDSLVKYELDGFMLRDILAIIDYLRSKHYDCGYLQISSLIEAGLAVKATK